MEQSIKKFLEFNGKKIFFKSSDGIWWIAIKPICEALKVNYERQRQNIQASKILGQLPTIQQVVAADGRLREMLCLPEFFIYGWMFKLQSDSPLLEEYQWKCYELLYNYFHGGMTERLSHLKAKTEAEKELEAVEAELKNSELYQKRQSLIHKIRNENAKANKVDKEFIASQMELWETMPQVT